MAKNNKKSTSNGSSAMANHNNCDKMNDSWKYSLVILFGALSISYYIYIQQPINIAKSTNNENIAIQTAPSNRNAQQSNNINEYNPELMIRFIDEVLNSTLDDFVTIDNKSVNLTELSKFNNNHFAPRILSLVKLDPFKFVKFNLKRPCLLWPDTFSCTKIGCNIKFCNRSQLPKEYLVLDENCPTDSPKELSKLDQTLKEDNVNELNRLFECSRDDSEQSQYYDLILNPERFTGYDGVPIWKAIYEENCFSLNYDANHLIKNGNESNNKYEQQPLASNANNMITSLINKKQFLCQEQKFFYRIISGLHTSITIHLTAIHHKFDNHFGPNPKDFFKRFYGHDDYLRNLFLTYLVELRALYRIKSYLSDKIQWNLIGDQVQAKEAINALLSTERLFRWHFDERLLFERQPILKQLGYVFNNITFNIMDCVSCDKCRLWGKVQTNGLGTAFKILLIKDLDKDLRLSHHEITCLLNAVSRLSFSITQITQFRQIFEREMLTMNNGKKLINDFIIK